MQNRETVLVPLADGFEEIEAVTIVDVLRRAGLHVTLAGLEAGSVEGAHGIVLETDASLAEVSPSEVLALVLPGGQPGTDRLASDERVLELARTLEAEGCVVAAICAAPLVLARAGLLRGRPATSHPSVRGALEGADVLDEPRVVRADRIFTSQGPGTALEFALALVEELVGASRARELAEAMRVAAVPR